MHSDDGITWTGELLYGAVQERPCPLGTSGNTACAYTFATDPPQTDLGRADEDDDDTEPLRTRDDEEIVPAAAPATCACTTTTPGVPWAPLLVALFALALGLAQRRASGLDARAQLARRRSRRERPLAPSDSRS
jgi:hypothetical protein